MRLIAYFTLAATAAGPVIANLILPNDGGVPYYLNHNETATETPMNLTARILAQKARDAGNFTNVSSTTPSGFATVVMPESQETAPADTPAHLEKRMIHLKQTYLTGAAADDRARTEISDCSAVVAKWKSNSTWKRSLDEGELFAKGWAPDGHGGPARIDEQQSAFWDTVTIWGGNWLQTPTGVHRLRRQVGGCGIVTKWYSYPACREASIAQFRISLWRKAGCIRRAIQVAGGPNCTDVSAYGWTSENSFASWLNDFIGGKFKDVEPRTCFFEGPHF